MKNFLQKFSRKERYELLVAIIEIDNLSITNIVQAKEDALNNENEKLQTLTARMGMRMTAMFGSDKEVLKSIKNIRELVKEDIKKSGALKGTKFEKEYILTNK